MATAVSCDRRYPASGLHHALCNCGRHTIAASAGDSSASPSWGLI